MHDPMTVAFEIKYPWRGRKSQWWPKGYRSPFITIWHIDPETDGSDDSCDWFGQKRKLSKKEKAIFGAMYDLETILDNRPFFPDHPAHLEFQPLKNSIRKLRYREGWRIHPRWHVWHWKLQIHPWQSFKRWAFSRCIECKGRFRWNESVLSHRGGIAHMKCGGGHVGSPANES